MARRSAIATLIRRLFALTLLATLALAGIGAWLVLSPQSIPREVVVDIPRGAGSRQIARILTREGVLSSELPFLTLRAMRLDRKLQAGEYSFSGPISPWQVFDKIARGEIYFREVNFPEGSNLFDMAEKLDSEGLLSGAAFRKAAKNTTLIRDIAPGAPSLEGYLFPATYRITKTTTAESLVKEMTVRFRRAWKQAGGTNQDVHRYVTLASLVEKETGVPEERTRVASVYQNRLDRGMKLDCDPTTIYAALLEGRYRGTIYRSDLDNPHPYNTYRNPGLPPGPIANPGLLSLTAALRPAQTDYLFFVAKADGSGGHVFSNSVEGHNKAVESYRRAQKGKAASPASGRPGAGKSGGA
jgi:UPF0755 protein